MEPILKGTPSQLLLLLISNSCVLNFSEKEQRPLLFNVAPSTQVVHFVEDWHVRQSYGHFLHQDASAEVILKESLSHLSHLPEVALKRVYSMHPETSLTLLTAQEAL